MDTLQIQLPVWLTLMLLVLVLVSIFVALAFGYRMGQGKPMISTVPQMVRSIVGETPMPAEDPLDDEMLTLEDCRRELMGLKTIATVREE